MKYTHRAVQTVRRYVADNKTDQKQLVYIYAIAAKKVIDAPFPLAANYAYDSFWRDVYNKAAESLGDQERQLLARGNVTDAEAWEVVEVQRNVSYSSYKSP